MSIKNPTAIFYDSAGVELAVPEGAAIPAGTRGIMLAGDDGTNPVFLRVASDGTVRMDPTGTTTQPVSAAALPLPAGASTAANQGTIIGHIDGLEALLTTLNGKDFATQTTLVALLAKNTEIDTVLDTIYTRQNNRTQKAQLTNGTIDVSVTADASINRLEILGKVAITGATAPPSTAGAVIYADTPLTVGTHDTVFVIPNGGTFHLQEVVAGNEDPTKGCVVEVIYYNGTERLIARVYRNGVTRTEGYPDVVKARDGTALVGNVGGTNTIIVRRKKYSGSDIAIDAVLRGYTV